ncbi:hypothetical protein ACF07V_20040 [Streptomyces sp. NPDC015661]|uniref:hypothetical protein n=1 Tax=Streptomyces sp. NPDC015661 TaxID=3364961 RepID=UPI0036FD2EE1
MLEEVVTALAATGGAAVVQAAGTDAWGGFRTAVARWFGRGRPERERVEIERLDRSAAALEAGHEVDRAREEGLWQARFEALFESVDGADRAQAVTELRSLLTTHVPVGPVVTADRAGLSVGGDADVRADRGSVAALRMGDVVLGSPSQPGPDEG